MNDAFGLVVAAVLFGFVGVADLLVRLGGLPLVVASALTLGAGALAIPFLVWRSAFRPVIWLGLALAVIGAALVALSFARMWSPDLAQLVFPQDSRGLGRLFALLAGIQLLAWGGTTAAFAAAARRAARVESAAAGMLQLLAALPSLLVVILFALALTKV